MTKNMASRYFNSEVVHSLLIFYQGGSKVLTYLGFSVMLGLVLEGKGAVKGFYSTIGQPT